MGGFWPRRCETDMGLSCLQKEMMSTLTSHCKLLCGWVYLKEMNYVLTVCKSMIGCEEEKGSSPPFFFLTIYFLNIVKEEPEMVKNNQKKKKK